MSRCFATLAAAVSMLAGVTAAQAADAAAKREPRVEAAATQLNLEIVKWNNWRRQCSELLSAHAVGIGTFFVHWLSENRDAVRGMVAYAEHAKLPGFAYSVVGKAFEMDVLTRASRLSGRRASDECMETLAKLKAGDFDFAKVYPDMARVLKDYLAAHPLSASAARAYDNPLGCLKSGLNQKFDYDTTISLCGCLWNAMNSTCSQAEWTQYEAAVASGDAEKFRASPQFKRAEPKLGECRKQLSPR